MKTNWLKYYANSKIVNGCNKYCKRDDLFKDNERNSKER